MLAWAGSSMKNLSQMKMTFKNFCTKSSASTHMRTGNASGLADSRVWNAGSDSDKSSEHPKTLFKVASLNVGSLKSRGSEVIETIFRRKMDICAIQEHRWAGGTESNQFRILKGQNKTKFYWCGNKSGLGGAGFLLAEKWTHNVFEVHREDSNTTSCFWGICVHLCFGLCPTSWSSEWGKNNFLWWVAEMYLKSTIFWDSHPIGWLEWACWWESWWFWGRAWRFWLWHPYLWRWADFRIRNGQQSFCRQYLFHQRRVPSCDLNSGGSKSQIDFMLYRKTFKSMVKNVKIILGKKCALQHHLLVCDLVHTIRRIVKRKFNPRFRTWKLREPAVAKEFAISLNAKLTAAQVMNFPNVEEIWAHLKKSLLETSSEVCGTSLNHQWKRQTWCWNASVDDAVNEKKNRYKVFNSFKFRDYFF